MALFDVEPRTSTRRWRPRSRRARGRASRRPQGRAAPSAQSRSGRHARAPLRVPSVVRVHRLDLFHAPSSEPGRPPATSAGRGGRASAGSRRDPGVDSDLGRRVDADADAGEPAAAAEERVEVRDLGGTRTPRPPWFVGRSLRTVMRSMPWPRPFGATRSPRSMRHVTWPSPGPVVYSGLRKRSSGRRLRDEDDRARRRLVDDPDHAQGDLRQERPVGAGEPLEVLGLPQLPVEVRGQLDGRLLDRLDGAGRGDRPGVRIGQDRHACRRLVRGRAGKPRLEAGQVEAARVAELVAQRVDHGAGEDCQARAGRTRSARSG